MRYGRTLAGAFLCALGWVSAYLFFYHGVANNTFLVAPLVLAFISFLLLGTVVPRKPWGLLMDLAFATLHACFITLFVSIVRHPQKRVLHGIRDIWKLPPLDQALLFSALVCLVVSMLLMLADTLTYKPEENNNSHGTA